MAMSAHLLFAILQIWALFLTILVHAQEQKGFISIDCGTSKSNYKDEQSGITYLSDTNFVQSGENRKISSVFNAQTNEQQLLDVRSFPEGTRNCYTLKPSGNKGTRYLIRARFMYGNYDNENKPPTFDLYIGVDLWKTMIINNAYDTVDTEILHVPSSDQIQVCLVNTNFGTPFISVLELRPLQTEAYKSETATLLLQQRNDYGSASNKPKRYIDDPYDRLWTGFSTTAWIPLNISAEETKITQDVFEEPFIVMSTAYTKDRNATYMKKYWEKQNTSTRFYFVMYFAELEKLETNQTRSFNVYVNDFLWYGPVVPKYLKSFSLYSLGANRPNDQGNMEIWFNKTESSTLPPLVNGLEVYLHQDSSGQETYRTDISGILGIKTEYRLNIANWQGDPCFPAAYSWNHLKCSYKNNLLARITYLNLSSSGLNGEISSSIGNFSMLEYLDLSNNNLTGTLPEFLADLSFLKLLNLTGNQNINVTGPILNALMKKKGLVLSLDSNPNSTTILCSSCKSTKKNKLVGPLVGWLCGVSVIVIIGTAIWIFKRKRKQKAMDLRVESVNVERREEEEEDLFVSKHQQFSYSEIEKITRNFERVLGEGGFGKVYHGYLNGKEVAVKMLSSSSIQGERQFQAELKLLLRVHHKNLTVLVGYCNDPTNIGLIYEYMAMGNLRSHLSSSTKTILSWEDRLRIAIDTAQGLEYLHNGCKPPIVHRDVKSTNILLNEKFQAKLGDFGLSKIFPLEGHANHVTNSGTDLGITTSIAGTPGYLDPEFCIANRLNEKSDVFSFGVVLLEIITARPVLTKKRENIHITQWVDSLISKGDIENVLDSRLQGDCDINTVWKAIEIAMACVSTKSSNRPTMSLVLTELKDCLISEVTRKERYDDITDLSKDLSGDNSRPVMISEYSPRAR